jgi:hypothetical protein
VEGNGDLWWIYRPIDIHFGNVILTKYYFPSIVKAFAGISTSFCNAAAGRIGMCSI